VGRKLIYSLAIGVGATLLALLLLILGVLDPIEYGTWSWRVRTLSARSASSERVKLILLDQASLDWGAKENGLPWPWPREVYGPILDFCKRGGAKAIAFDVLYTESSDSEHVAQDEALGEAIRRAGNLVAPVFLGEQTVQTQTWPGDVPRPSIEVAGLSEWLTPARKTALGEPAAAFPIAQVATNAVMLANVKDVPDSDGVFRRAALFRLFDGVPVPSLGLAAYLLALSPSERRIELRDRWVDIGSAHLPVDRLGRTVLRFRGGSGTHETFSAAAIIQSELRLQEGDKPTLQPSALKDCYVFFGFSAPGLKDLRPTPVSGDYPGVEIHATLLDNLLERDSLRDASPWAAGAATLLLAVLAAAMVVLSRNVFRSVLAFGLFLPIPFAAGLLAYVAGWWWPVALPAAGTALALVSGVVLNYATEGRQKRFIKSAFKQYLGETVIDDIIRDPARLKLGGEKKELTMFFSDLEKFSSFSERLSPTQLIDLLNLYLSDMGEIIIEEGGYLDKFVGDAIVAFWNAPLAQEDHAVRAVRAALRCQRRLAERRAEIEKRMGALLKMRVGINTGDVVVGNMGSRDRFNYTMLGDAANLASRLEGANKAFGSYTIVSESTWSHLRGAIIGRELGALRVVGRKAPVRVFEPVCVRGETPPPHIDPFARALDACRERRWKEALTLFQAIGDDPPSRAYAAKLRELAEKGGEWDGVWNLTEK
jgi:adenylate cyclase